ncbi:phenylacetate-CoA oxygenase subunit PaaC [Rhodococcus sp. BP-252]|uniref:1,2-phenylacetyl-CoA epoxidase subunit PaaC n=1 Tax=unclassified Rhodococcus (in: high G+C Gram-positive bacteria) TaxID=192944 RepID=UPI001C9A4AD6|nr:MULTISPECIES: 1,2-phenylacetyl-CoA epoxidase subunit PaaC [unclassified Rhodococcus (in: high G+C Gram-positive bacteria)]MBY6412838.1 phenylacetate-CoA oxygenase subunit PaaC [Rhodococcus sp. BP-320]MBY6417625.1 phenylacetate-CoA oxygenase subunit PaaC [Rhodococcus sp. BP-321]MBY6423477.1 phenylacetate-CoA oxygenase subunit PaaC [Rhodococcus sp. BP-324]MBY6427649.1 phenylacetate-CoA oxygenase subunit PaaC [Rhodococcus sp. BP-323]MBY6432813.1 phenylacetate-CoA oxygenase subunit PaaC [Rhodoc
MTDHDNAYEGLVDEDSHGQWAFGTSFDDPLAGVDTTVPDDVDLEALAAYCLMLGDDALISAQRLAQWSTRAPELEEEVALANVGLDLLGQARLLLARAAAANPSVVPFISDTSPVPSEDALAFFRDEATFRNVRLTELDNGDFAKSQVRLLVFSTWRLAIFARLRTSRDPVLAAVAEKGIKELTYHRDYAARWVVTLGCGTDESIRRVRDAIAHVWPYVSELFIPTDEEIVLARVGVAVDPRDVREEFDSVLTQVLHAAELHAPEGKAVGTIGGRGGRRGIHTESFGPLIAEMQVVARAHPEGVW